MNIPGGIIQTVILMASMIIIGAIVADMYGIVQKNEKRSIATQQEVNATSSQVNATVARILEGQNNANLRGNLTLSNFATLFANLIGTEKNILGNLTDHRIVANMTRDLLEYSINQSVVNQEQYFKPYLNESFEKIFNALNITSEEEARDRERIRERYD